MASGFPTPNNVFHHIDKGVFEEGREKKIKKFQEKLPIAIFQEG
jgi:hypothetical protein